MKYAKRPAGAPYGCPDGGCIFGDTGGLHTNGNCNCISRRIPLPEQTALRTGILALRERIAELENRTNAQAKQIKEDDVLGHMLDGAKQAIHALEYAERIAELEQKLRDVRRDVLAGIEAGMSTMVVGHEPALVNALAGAKKAFDNLGLQEES